MKNIIKILKLIGAIFLIIGGVWLAVLFKVNIGKILAKLLGTEIIPNPTDLNGLEIGTSHTIKINNNPLRDKSVAELDNGVIIKLPEGVIDDEVSKVIIVSQGVINVVKKTTDNLTDIFNTP